MKSIIKSLGKFLFIYLIAGAALLVFNAYPDFEGHADVPFSDFPSMLIFSPVAPVILFVKPKLFEILLYVLVLFGGLYFLFKKVKMKTPNPSFKRDELKGAP